MSFGGGSGGSGSISTSTDVALNNPSDNQVLGYNTSLAKWQNQTPAAATPDATTTAKGKVQLAGDLGGTADAPTVPGLAAKADSIDVPSQLADLTGVLQTTQMAADSVKMAIYDTTTGTWPNSPAALRQDIHVWWIDPTSDPATPLPPFVAGRDMFSKAMA